MAVFSEDGVRIGDVHLKRGQWLRSTRNLIEDLAYVENRQVKKYSTSVINRCIKKLEREQRICTKTHELGTIFTVINYEQYQGFMGSRKKNLEHNLEQYQNIVGTVEEQSGNNNKKDNNAINAMNDFKESTTPNAFVVFEREGFGTLSSTLAEKLGSFIDDFGERWVIEAMKEAAYHSKRSLPYVKSILEDYRRRGVDEPWTVERTQQQKGFIRQQTKTGKPEMRVVSGSPAPEISQEERQRMRELARELKTS
ncbi:DnaD domain protein [Cohnella xylanilytica]|uniref:DnaD domain protein n=2 Tax=Cohnella xylanilytica TaxID=557555 RepID=A0A841U5P7_9BACL|nr:DnaD domain protein [Cohnella xylanilytica]